MKCERDYEEKKRMRCSIIGIDFGTCTTVVRVLNYDESGPSQVYAVKDDGMDTLDSAVYERKVGDGSSEWFYGRTAINRSRRTVPGSKLYQNFKVELLSKDDVITERAKFLVEKYFADYIAKCIERMVQCGKLELFEKKVVCVSVPSKWPLKVKEFMRRTVLKAKITCEESNVKVVDEPVAAARMAISSPAGWKLAEECMLANKDHMARMMVLDMGAGTTDISIFKLKATEYGGLKVFDLVSFPSADNEIWCGGKEIDEILLAEVKQGGVEILPNQMEKWRYYIRNIKEKDVSVCLRDNDSFCFKTLDDCFTLYEGEDITRQRFEMLTHKHWESLHSLIIKAFELSTTKYKITPADLDLVILTGGHSKWYCVEELFKTGKLAELPEINFAKIKNDPGRVLYDEDRSTTVAEGLVRTNVFEDKKGDEFSAKKHQSKRGDFSRKEDAAHHINKGIRHIEFEQVLGNSYWIQAWIYGDNILGTGFHRVANMTDKLPFSKEFSLPRLCYETLKLHCIKIPVRIDLAYGSDVDHLTLCDVCRVEVDVPGRMLNIIRLVIKYASVLPAFLPKFFFVPDKYEFAVKGRIEIAKNLTINSKGQLLAWWVDGDGTKNDEKSSVFQIVFNGR